MDQQWIYVVILLLFHKELNAGEGKEHICKEGQPVEITCKPLELGSSIMWFRVLDNHSGMEFLASFSNNGLSKSASDSFSSTFHGRKIRDNVLTLKSFRKAEHSGIYSCATIKDNQMKFGAVTRLTGVKAFTNVMLETVELKPFTTTSPCVCGDANIQVGNMMCSPFLLIPVAGICFLLLLVICIILVYCNRVRIRRCPHHYKKRPRKKRPVGKQQQQNI
ncbi:T-cell surface glycoprotein CD8 alpha chain [Stigmatopora nigra]